MIAHNTVLDEYKHLRLEKYAATPILNAMCECAREASGQVFVAMVPPGLGKTTATAQFLLQFQEYRQGIAICGTHGATPFVHEMLGALGLSHTHPPNGWLKCLVTCLHAAAFTKPHRKPYLILDDVIGFDADAQLLMALNDLLRGSRATVIVLTRKRESADFFLSKSGLQGIVPLPNTYPKYKEIFPRGEWASMRWDLKTYKMAARHQPLLAGFSRDAVEYEIDEYAVSLSQEQLDTLRPIQLWNKVRERLNPENIRTASHTSSCGEEGGEFVSCTHCVVS
ncbi:MAG: hypothetical protein SGILL_002471 [Bacillariaceae sp.]